MIFLKLGKSIKRYLGLYSCGAIILGLVVGNIYQSLFLKPLIPVALLLMLYPAMFDIEIERIKREVIKPKSLVIAIVGPLVQLPIMLCYLRLRNVKKIHQ
ncbi:MAG: hypothetical protein AB1414_17025 [bacterium]